MAPGVCAARKLERTDFLFQPPRASGNLPAGATRSCTCICNGWSNWNTCSRTAADRGQGFVYELVYDGEGKDGGRFLPGLLDVEKLRTGHDYDAEASGVFDRASGVKRRSSGPRPALIRGQSGGHPARENRCALL